MIEKLLDKKVRDFILQHEEDDPAKLLLQQEKFQYIPFPEAVDQIIARKKARDKTPFWYDHDKVVFPTPVSVEQASSESTAQFKARLLDGTVLADLSGGMGVDSWAFARHFQKVFYVEKDPGLCKLARHNFNALDKKNIEVVNAEAISFLERADLKVNCLYVDPSRRSKDQRKVFMLQDCEPKIHEVIGQSRSAITKILIKTSPLLDIHSTLSEIKGVSKVFVVSVNNECKEVLYLLDQNWAGSTEIACVNLETSQKEFSFRPEEEDKIELAIDEEPRAGFYLYEPNSSILKAGAFKSIAKLYNLEKLHTNSHLYWSEDLVKDFPGRSFEIVGITPVNAKEVKKIIQGDQANVTKRNFPMSVDALRKKLGIREGGEWYLFATTLTTDQKRLLVCKKT